MIKYIKITLMYMFAVVVLVVATRETIKQVYFDYELYQKESQCVYYYVTTGVERADIVTDNGTCYVKTNKD